LASTKTIASRIHDLTDVNVTLKINGTFNGDLYAYLVHRSGFSVLLNRVGKRAGDPLGYSDDGVDIKLDDQAASDVHVYRLAISGNHTTPLVGPLTGSWKPDGRLVDPDLVLDTDPRTELLSSFNGENPTGDWTLFVADLSAGDVSTLVSWGLELCGPVNRAPIARNNGAATSQDKPVGIALHKLLDDDSDPEGDTLSVISVTSSTNGANVQLTGTNVIYTPTPGFVGLDRFSYTISDGHSATATADVEVIVLDGGVPSGNSVMIQAVPGGFRVRFAGIPGYKYDLQRSPTLSPAMWTTIATLTAPLHGIMEYVDTTIMPTAFYRTVPSP
jgi:subtilisin-like proprotein convertase family protein